MSITSYGPNPTDYYERADMPRDPAELSLSELQKKAFDGWRRPGDTSFASMSARLSQNVEPTMITLTNADLVQDMTSDCSVVASLCAGAARAERGHPKAGAV